MVDSTAPTDRSNEAVIHDLGHLRVTSITVGEYENNAYLLECVATGERLLIDAAAKSAVLLELLAGGGLAQVLTTHFHTTTGALRDVVVATTATTLAPADAPGIPVPTTVQVRGGDRVRVGKITLDTLHLVEHTAGSLALAYAQPGGPLPHTDRRHALPRGHRQHPRRARTVRAALPRRRRQGVRRLRRRHHNLAGAWA